MMGFQKVEKYTQVVSGEPDGTNEMKLKSSGFNTAGENKKGPKHDHPSPI